MSLRMMAVALTCFVACSAADGPAPAPADASASGDAVADGARPDSAVVDAASCKLLQPYSSKNVVCNDCAQARCCVAVNACLGDTRCNDDYVNCILACALLPADAGPDAAGVAKDCVAQCGVDFPVGRSEYDAAIGCVDAQCAAECQ